MSRELDRRRQGEMLVASTPSRVLGEPDGGFSAPDPDSL